MNRERSIDPAVETFIARLEKLADERNPDRASLARLKRGAGKTLAECAALMPLFYRLLPSTLGRRANGEEWCFVVATLFPFAPKKWSGNLGASLRLLANQPKVNKDGIDRRMAILLDAGPAELPFRLRQVIGLLKQHDLPLDWRQLLQDLRGWQHESRFVQKEWARHYFGWTGDEQQAPGAAETPGATDDE